MNAATCGLISLNGHIRRERNRVRDQIASICTRAWEIDPASVIRKCAGNSRKGRSDRCCVVGNVVAHRAEVLHANDVIDLVFERSDDGSAGRVSRPIVERLSVSSREGWCDRSGEPDVVPAIVGIEEPESVCRRREWVRQRSAIVVGIDRSHRGRSDKVDRDRAERVRSLNLRGYREHGDCGLSGNVALFAIARDPLAPERRRRHSRQKRQDEYEYLHAETVSLKALC